MSVSHFTDESLLSELEKLDVVKQRTESNREAALIKKLPKLTVLEKIMPYLQLSEINSLALACRSLKALIHGPVGFKLVAKTRVFDSIKFIKTDVIDKINIVVTEIRPECDSLRIKTPPSISRVERAPQNNHSEPHSRDELIIHSSRIQLDSQNRTPTKRANTFDLQHKVDDAEIADLKLENEELKELLKEHKTIISDLNLKYQNLLAEKEKELIRMYRENNELRAHRKILAQEIINLRDSLGKSELEKIRFFDCLISVNKAIE